MPSVRFLARAAYTSHSLKVPSFISSINLGADVTGEAHAVLYPDGVISAEDYNFSLPEDADKLEEYKNKSPKHKCMVMHTVMSILSSFIISPDFYIIFKLRISVQLNESR